MWKLYSTLWSYLNGMTKSPHIIRYVTMYCSDMCCNCHKSLHVHADGQVDTYSCWYRNAHEFSLSLSLSFRRRTNIVNWVTVKLMKWVLLGAYSDDSGRISNICMHSMISVQLVHFWSILEAIIYLFAWGVLEAKNLRLLHAAETDLSLRIWVFARHILQA